jgi:hypothetical protein
MLLHISNKTNTKSPCAGVPSSANCWGVDVTGMTVVNVACVSTGDGNFYLPFLGSLMEESKRH